MDRWLGLVSGLSVSRRSSEGCTGPQVGSSPKKTKHHLDAQHMPTSNQGKTLWGFSSLGGVIDGRDWQSSEWLHCEV